MAEIGKVTVKFSVDEITLLRRVVEEARGSRLEVAKGMNRSSDEWRETGQEVLALEGIGRGLRG